MLEGAADIEVVYVNKGVQTAVGCAIYIKISTYEEGNG
jgi:hypothetical protein